MTELLVVVSSFNRLGLLREAMTSLSGALQDLSAAVVVFDAGSSDGSREWIEEYRKKSRTPIHLTGPLRESNSFSAGVNHAVAHGLSLHSDARLICLFETDNSLRDASPLKAAWSLLEGRDDLGAVGFTVRKHSGGECGYGCPFPSVTSFAVGPQLSSVLRLDRPVMQWKTAGDLAWSECDVVYTSPLLVRKEAWERSGGFDSATFPFSDCDLDWAWRLRKLGLKQAVLRTDAVVHDNRETLSNWSASRAVHFHRARFRLLRRHRGSWVMFALPVLWMRHVGELLVSLAPVASRGKYKARLKKRWLLAARSLASYR